jgi:hypothetical protein
MTNAKSQYARDAQNLTPFRYIGETAPRAPTDSPRHSRTARRCTWTARPSTLGIASPNARTAPSTAVPTASARSGTSG